MPYLRIFKPQSSNFIETLQQFAPQAEHITLIFTFPIHKPVSKHSILCSAFFSLRSPAHFEALPQAAPIQPRFFERGLFPSSLLLSRALAFLHVDRPDKAKVRLLVRKPTLATRLKPLKSHARLHELASFIVGCVCRQPACSLMLSLLWTVLRVIYNF